MSAAKPIATIVVELSAEGSHVVIKQTTSAISEPLSPEVDRVRTVVISEKVDGAVISERTVTSVITEEAEYNFAADERRERIRKLGLVDRPVINQPGLAERLRPGGRVILSKDEGAFLADLVVGKSRPAHRPQSADTAVRNDYIAEMYLWLEASKPMQKGRPVQKGELARVVARHWHVNPDYVRALARELSPRRRKQIENDMRAHGPLSPAAKRTREREKERDPRELEAWHLYVKTRNPHWQFDQIERAVECELKRLERK